MFLTPIYNIELYIRTISKVLLKKILEPRHMKYPIKTTVSESINRLLQKEQRNSL